MAGPGAPLPPPWFDHQQHAVAGNHLHPKEWQVLEILWRRRPNFVTTDTLMTLLYSDQPDDPPHDKIIAVFICRVRAALGPTPYSIRTLWLDGYQLLDFKDPGGEPTIGGIDDNVPLPPPPTTTRSGWPVGDKYQFAGLAVGQSRRIDNANLAQRLFESQSARLRRVPRRLRRCRPDADLAGRITRSAICSPFRSLGPGRGKRANSCLLPECLSPRFKP